MNLAKLLAMLDETADLWPAFVDSRLKGTPRIVTLALSPTPGRKRPEDDGMVGYGAVPAPIHLDVLDAMDSIHRRLAGLVEHLADTLDHQPPTPMLTLDTDQVPDLIRYCADHLPAACEQDRDMLPAAWDRVVPIHARVLGGLGLLVDGQRLDAICPFCQGLTFEARGVPTLVVRVIPSRIKTARPGEMEPVIICENPSGCTVLAAECGLWVRDRPAWPMAEWDWLAQRLTPNRRSSHHTPSHHTDKVVGA